MVRVESACGRWVFCDGTLLGGEPRITCASTPLEPPWPSDAAMNRSLIGPVSMINGLAAVDKIIRVFYQIVSVSSFLRCSQDGTCQQHIERHSTLKGLFTNVVLDLMNAVSSPRDVRNRCNRQSRKASQDIKSDTAICFCV